MWGLGGKSEVLVKVLGSEAGDTVQIAWEQRQQSVSSTVEDIICFPYGLESRCKSDWDQHRSLAYLRA